MKSISIILALLTSGAFAQEEEPSGWKVMPSVTIVKYLPGGHRQSVNGKIYPLYPLPGFVGGQFASETYSGTGVSLSARFFNEDINPFAITASAGANWYSMADGGLYAMPMGPVIDNSQFEPGNPNRPFDQSFSPMDGGRGRRGFMSFPLGAGVQFVYPTASREKLMFFAGAEGNLHFTTQNISSRDRVQAGYTLLGGFALKFVEIGVRWTAFGETKNLGVQLGIRLNQFDI